VDAGEPPWPGRLPQPAPATVLPQPLPANVTTADGTPVGVTGRLAVTGTPALVSIGNAAPAEVWGWAGPWPVDERWWAPDEADRRVRFQMLLADGRALLLALSGGRWVLEAVYD
jgi:protein ImuB